MMDAEYDYLFKILLIGHANVGKTALIHRFANGVYIEDCYIPTAAEWGRRTLAVEGKRLKLLLLDKAKPDQFIDAVPYKGANGIIIVYDVTDENSFKYLNTWLQEINQEASKDVCKLLVGNKCDLTTKKKVDYTTAKDFADREKIPFLETSAKSTTNVEKAFVTIATEMMRIRSGH